ncbi:MULTISPECIES: hypothetical protein [Pseudolactococcus]|jgi:hypothetical protein|uniref:Uncharacterized protein n=1 Tax=Pseudolactococcus piscium MKFS47 TaxID=297352 RepID=A0A0D6E0C5_9LACT|nr:MULTISPECIES: hypothetical protein [Lactococcus]MBQ2637065.1 hypothetical protein [Methanobrevibacter sp.]MBQ4163950.1 hypothetical protein [Turicibacter sp.]MBQ9658426.1 hypothetical protein [Clostridia bacterium]MCJ1971163.1 hypothetical protein [Lactococcus carnosus]CEN29532.1 Uncharacterized protein LACPI_2332 [Lactococcus piscium MKFS47]
MDITEFSMRALNSEVQMIDDFNFFDQKVNSFKNDLYLSPYATIKEVVLWCDVLIKYEAQIDILCQEAKNAILKKMIKINSKTIKSHFDVDEQTISVWSDYILDLIELDKRYQEVIYSFCISIDNCVRYIISYSKDLAEYEMNLPEIMERVKNLGTCHWLNMQSKTDVVGNILN